jgi:hypothetical protein
MESKSLLADVMDKAFEKTSIESEKINRKEKL